MNEAGGSINNQRAEAKGELGTHASQRAAWRQTAISNKEPLRHQPPPLARRHAGKRAYPGAPLPAEFAKDADRLKRFEQEARVTSALNHPNILTVYDVGAHAGNPYLPGDGVAGGQWKISINGGVYTQWRRDGRELYYVTPDGKLMVVEITPGAELKAGTPKELFAPGGYQVDALRNYTVTGDGQRFLFVTNAEESSLPSFTVVLNWMAEVKK